MTVEDPACEHHLHWMVTPNTVLIMKKFKDPQVTTKFKQLCTWIIMVQQQYRYCIVQSFKGRKL